MGHLPARTRGGRRLLPLLWLFVLLKVGDPSPSRRGPACARAPAPSLCSGGAARPGSRWPGCWQRPRCTLCCPCVYVFSAGFRDGVEGEGSLLPPAFPLCALVPPPACASKVGLSDGASSDKMRSLSLLVAAAPRCCLTFSPSPNGVSGGFALIYLLLELYTGGRAPRPQMDCRGWVVSMVFFD